MGHHHHQRVLLLPAPPAAPAAAAAVDGVACLCPAAGCCLELQLQLRAGPPQKQMTARQSALLSCCPWLLLHGSQVTPGACWVPAHLVVCCAAACARLRRQQGWGCGIVLGAAACACQPVPQLWRRPRHLQARRQPRCCRAQEGPLPRLLTRSGPQQRSWCQRRQVLTLQLVAPQQ